MILPSTVSIVPTTTYSPGTSSHNTALPVFELAIGTEVPFRSSIRAPVHLVEQGHVTDARIERPFDHPQSTMTPSGGGSVVNLFVTLQIQLLGVTTPATDGFGPHMDAIPVYWC